MRVQTVIGTYDANEERRRILGDFLRTRRNRRDPLLVGLSRRARGPGLRREDVAALAGISVSWYSWLEAGRAISVSRKSLLRVIDVLGLDSIEADYVIALAGSADRLEPLPEVAADELSRIVVPYAGGPAFVLDELFDTLAFNTLCAYAYRFRGPQQSGLDRNLLWRYFTWPESRAAFADYDEGARALLGRFRRSYIRHVGDERFEELIEQLRAASSFFDALWTRHDITGWIGVHRLNILGVDEPVEVSTVVASLDDSRERLLVFHPVIGPPKAQTFFSRLVDGYWLGARLKGEPMRGETETTT